MINKSVIDKKGRDYEKSAKSIVARHPSGCGLQSAGPFGLLNLVDQRCGGTFDDIDDVIPARERADFMAGYKVAAGFAVDALNKSAPTIATGARLATR